jgi:AcrR family transcriptional regulator
MATVRRRLDADDRRRQLVELGLEMLSRQPREQVAVDRIAAVAGISRGLLFHYFPSKRDYHIAVVEAACARLLERTEPDAALEPQARLRRSLDAYLEFMEANQALYRSLIRGAAGADQRLEEIFQETRDAVVRRVLDYLQLPEPPELLRVSLLGWVGFVEDSTLDWLRRRTIGRAALVDLQVRLLDAALTLHEESGADRDGGVDRAGRQERETQPGE